MPAGIYLTSEEAFYVAQNHCRCVDCGHLDIFHDYQDDWCHVLECTCRGLYLENIPLSGETFDVDIDVYSPW